MSTIPFLHLYTSPFRGHLWFCKIIVLLFVHCLLQHSLNHSVRSPSSPILQTHRTAACNLLDNHVNPVSTTGWFSKMWNSNSNGVQKGQYWNYQSFDCIVIVLSFERLASSMFGESQKWTHCGSKQPPIMLFMGSAHRHLERLISTSPQRKDPEMKAFCLKHQTHHVMHHGLLFVSFIGLLAWLWHCEVRPHL